MTMPIKSRVFLALGGNLGNPRQAFATAARELRQHPQIELVAAAPLYRTPPVGGPADQPDYLNTVIELTTDLTPQQLLAFSRKIEDAAGRTRSIRWGARTLDLDLLLYARQIVATPELTLPHPRLQQRHFVLLPLADLAPDFIHPQLQVSVAELLARLPQAEGITRLETDWIDND